jgi:hypothetical protein
MCISLIVICKLSMIFITSFEKYPSSLLSLVFSFFLAKSDNTDSQKLSISFFRFSIILLFLHSHIVVGIYATTSSNPSKTTTILLEVRLFQGIVILKHPSLLYFIFNGRFSFFMMLFFSTTFLSTT